VRLNVLVVDRAPPVGVTQGNALIGHHVFGGLRHHRLVLVAAGQPGHDDARSELEEVFDEVHLVPRPRPFPSLGGWLEGFGATGPKGRRWASGMRARLTQVVSSGRFDVVHVRQLPMAAYAPSLGSLGRILELIDCETLASRRALPRRPSHVLRERVSAWIERRAMAAFDVTTTVGDADGRVLRELRPNARVEVVPNGVDARYWAPGRREAEDPTIVFSGSMSFPPNVAAATFLVREILPRVRQSEPDARVELAGRDPGFEVLALRGPYVDVTGTVQDLRPHLAGRVVVCPMVSGSGVKNKVLEALAMGRPVVATPLAIEGLPAVKDGRHLVVGRSAAELARHVVELLRRPDRRSALGQAGRQLVMAAYTWEACAARYDALYQELAAETRRRKTDR
jgi:glycosyltransferase involved in cell wall biosynthesis